MDHTARINRTRQRKGLQASDPVSWLPYPIHPLHDYPALHQVHFNPFGFTVLSPHPPDLFPASSYSNTQSAGNFLRFPQLLISAQNSARCCSGRKCTLFFCCCKIRNKSSIFRRFGNIQGSSGFPIGPQGLDFPAPACEGPGEKIFLAGLL